MSFPLFHVCYFLVSFLILFFAWHVMVIVLVIPGREERVPAVSRREEQSRCFALAARGVSTSGPNRREEVRRGLDRGKKQGDFPLNFIYG